MNQLICQLQLQLTRWFVATSLIREVVIIWVIHKHLHTQPSSRSGPGIKQSAALSFTLMRRFCVFPLTNQLTQGFNMKVSFNSCCKTHVVYVCMFVCTDHAAALLAAVQPGRSAAVERASALVQTLAAGPVVAAGTAEQILVGVSAVTGSPPAVRLPVLHIRGNSQGLIVALAYSVWLTSKQQCQQKLQLHILGCKALFRSVFIIT